MKIVSTGRMSNRQFHANGKPNWWLRQGSGREARFVDIPRVRGDAVFEAELDLAPGTYVLGCGPNDKHGVRQRITVK